MDGHLALQPGQWENPSKLLPERISMIQSTLLAHMSCSLRCSDFGPIITHAARVLQSLPVQALACVAHEEILCICIRLLATRALNVGIVLAATGRQRLCILGVTNWSFGSVHAIVWRVLGMGCRNFLPARNQPRWVLWIDVI